MDILSSGIYPNGNFFQLRFNSSSEAIFVIYDSLWTVEHTKFFLAFVANTFDRKMHFRSENVLNIDMPQAYNDVTNV